MANAMQDALNRASKSPGFKEAQEALKTNNVSLAVNNTDRAATQNTPSNDNSVEAALNRTSSQDKQVIEAGKSHITMVKNADEITPQNTPSNRPANTNEQQLSANTQENIESAQQGQGNNYRYPNAMDRAQERPTQETYKPEPQPEKER